MVFPANSLSQQACQLTPQALAESLRPFAGAAGGQDSYTAIIRSAWLLSLVLIAAALGRPHSPLANATGIAAAVSVATTLLATAARPLPRPEASLSGDDAPDNHDVRYASHERACAPVPV